MARRYQLYYSEKLNQSFRTIWALEAAEKQAEAKSEAKLDYSAFETAVRKAKALGLSYETLKGLLDEAFED